MEEQNQMRMHIVPTVGRVVWYWPGGADEKDTMDYGNEQPLRADICYVHDDGTVNLSVNDCVGVSFTRRDIVLHQGDHLGCSLPRPFATWMPYQLGQAAKNQPPAQRIHSEQVLWDPELGQLWPALDLQRELLAEKVRELRLQNDAQEIVNARAKAQRS